MHWASFRMSRYAMLPLAQPTQDVDSPALCINNYGLCVRRVLAIDTVKDALDLEVEPREPEKIYGTGNVGGWLRLLAWLELIRLQLFVAYVQGQLRTWSAQVHCR